MGGYSPALKGPEALSARLLSGIPMITLKKLACGVASSALLLAAGTAAFAQETTSAIRGAVVDDAGQPVGAAEVTIIHVPSGTRSVVQTDDSGAFDARGLRVGGPYTVTVQAAEYEPETLSGLNLTVGETTRVNLDLTVAGTVDAVVVTAQRDPTAENSGTVTVLDRDRIEGVTSVTRDIRDLARRNPLVSQNTRGDQGISIAGSNPRQNRIAIDGVQAQDDYGLNTGGTPIRRGPVSLDAIEQFSVIAVPVDVENGDFTGGSLDVVLRSGGNEIEGSLFVNYLNDGLVGDSLRGARRATQITQTNYGAFVSGPIIRDRLFFALSYESYESADQTATGPTGEGFPNSVVGVTRADIENVRTLFDTNYATDFDIGDVTRSEPIIDEKYTAKLDWNITDSHRASLTYRYGLSELTQRNINQGTASLSSNWYLTGEEDYSAVAELNSQWTSNFSTQVRLTYRDYERRQLPPSGQEFAEISVCDVPTSVGTANLCDNPGGASPSQIRFGPDLSRQANELATDNQQFHVKAEYVRGDHTIKAGYQLQNQQIRNLFVQREDGVYYFDSYADFAAGRANQFTYQAAVGGADTPPAAEYEYNVHSVFLQDNFEITPDLELLLGFRYDWYTSDIVPRLNENFAARNGFSNQTTYDGITSFMPRARAEWRPREDLTLTAGVGLFTGGVPDVYVTNSFGAGPGNATSSIDIRRTAPGAATFAEFTGTPGFNQAIGAAALNVNRADPRFGYDIPALVRTFQGGGVANPLNEVAALTPGFEIPGDWKSFFSAQWEPLDDLRLGLDVVATRTQNAIIIRDTRAQPLIINGVRARLPDGRLRYDAINATAAQRAAQGVTSQAAVGGNNRDLVAFNEDVGEAFVTSIYASKRFDFGLDAFVSYTYQDLNDKGSSTRFASTASSTYQSPAGMDPNEPAEGPAYDEAEHSFKLDLSYEREFIQDFPTRVTLFAENRSGRKTSFTMGDATTGRGPVFGVNRGTNHLLFVPGVSADTDTTDLRIGNVFFDTSTTLANFVNAVNQFGLPENQIVPKGFYKNSAVNQVDMQISQRIPLVFGTRARLVFDIQNVLNLVNDDWGIVEEYRDVNQLVNVSCVTAAGATLPAGDFSCPAYRYSNFQSDALREQVDQNNRSFWAIQIGLRFEF
jgi:outer membrane receptor for ferrienterochelin and colicin